MSPEFGNGGPERKPPIIIKILREPEDVDESKPSTEEVFREQYPDAEKIIPLPEFASRIEKFRNLVAQFKGEHDLEKLNSIEIISDKLRLLFEDDWKMTKEEIEEKLGGLIPEEVEQYRIRVAAEVDIKPIKAILSTIQHSTPREQWFELWNGSLKEELKTISTAVGSINSGKITHD